MVILIIVLLVILSINKMTYLNYNSTCMTGGGEFNRSDLNYPEVIDERINEERLKSWIFSEINAPEDAKLIFTSGATESIATLLNWARSFNSYGVVYGSKLDHPSIKINANNIGMQYKQLKLTKTINIPENASVIFMTHVSPSTGDIYPIENMNKHYIYLAEEDVNSDMGYSNDEIRQYRPFKFLDASQSFPKLKIDMKEMNLDAVVLSPHKFGCQIGFGVLVFRDTNKRKFKPLIAGTQQDSMRGGTLPINLSLSIPNAVKEFKQNYSSSGCEKVYKMFTDMLDDEDIDYEKGIKGLKNLHNTVLIHLGFCNAGIIHELAEMGIYVGASSACNAETGEIDDTLRISYINDKDFTPKVMKKIIKLIHEYQKDKIDD